MIPPDPRPSVAVAIVNWNTSSVALAAAAAFAGSEGVRAEVTVVDNHSEEPERRILQGAPEGVRVLIEPRNHGFAVAANLALHDAQTDAVCVSNADVLAESGTLRTLTEVVLADPNIAMAAPDFGREGNTYHRRLPGAPTLLVRPFIGSFNSKRFPENLDGDAVDFEQPGGACFVMRTDLWRELGGLDPGFFLWYEDVDLARRARDAGLRNVVVRSARAAHTGGVAAARLDPLAQQTIRLRSLRRYVAKHHVRLLPAARLSIAAAAICRGVQLAGLSGARTLLAGVRRPH